MQTDCFVFGVSSAKNHEAHAWDKRGKISVMHLDRHFALDTINSSLPSGLTAQNRVYFETLPCLESEHALRANVSALKMLSGSMVMFWRYVRYLNKKIQVLARRNDKIQDIDDITEL